MQNTTVQTFVKTSSKSSTRCGDCGQPYDRCDCRWTITDARDRNRLINKASGVVRVLANTYKLTQVRITTGKTVREVTYIQGLRADVWLVESTPLPGPGNLYPKASFYTLDLETCECDCPDSARRCRAGLAVDHPLRPCKHIAALRAMLAKGEAA